MSPLLARRRGEGPVPGRGLQGTDRARRVGTGCSGGRCSHDHPLQALAGPYGARFAVMTSAFQVAGGPVLPTRYTHPVPHPVYPPGPVHHRTPTTSPWDGTTRACTYGSFRTRVGEPRGVEYRPVSGSRTGYIQLYTVYEVYTAV